MKRILTSLLSLITVFSLCACQPTPEKAVVAGKNSKRLIEVSAKEGAKDTVESLVEQYGIPDAYQFETQGKDGKLNIKVDAGVIVPDGNKMPIYRVKATDFTQEQVSALWDALCGDTEMWEMADGFTKSEIEEMIIGRKRFMKEEGEEDNPQALEQLKKLEEALVNAPETNKKERTDGKLITRHIYGDSYTTSKIIASYTGLHAEGGGLRFGVANNNDLEAEYTIQETEATSSTASVHRGAVIDYCNKNNRAYGTEFGYSKSIPVTEDSELDTKVLEKVGLSPKEVEQLVQDMLDSTNSGMVVDRMYLQDDEQLGNVNDIVRPAEDYVYIVYCVREVDGIPCAYITGASNAGEGASAASWEYERMEFLVNDEGVFIMAWMSPLQITETINEDAELKPFSEIREIFEKMMLIKYEAQSEWMESLDFEIDRVTLSLQRIAEQDSFEEGLLVPVWNFYGKQTEHYENGNFNEVIGASFLSVNAIDGSIIDTEKGY